MSAGWLLFFSTIPTIFILSAYAGLQELSITTSSTVAERTMISIFESCYDADNLFNPVLVIGDFNEFTDKIPMIRMNNFENLRSHSLSNFKITRVIIIGDSVYQIQHYIELLKSKSTAGTIGWWNHMASFFIIFKSKCSFNDAISIACTTAENNMINSIYICPESINTAVLNTVNFYANYAPHPWKFTEKEFEMFLFSQRFDKNISCSSLFYDKTKKLNGHMIKVLAGQLPGIYFDPKKNYLTEYVSRGDIPSKAIDIICEAWNVNCVLNIRTGRNTVIELVNEGRVDLVLELSSIEDYPTKKHLSPYVHDRIVAIIKSSPEKSTQSKIFHLWDFSVIYLAFTALVILCLILFWKNREFSSALLDIVRLIIYSAILTNVRSHSFRIFFTTILIMMIISNGVFQGKIAAFLTTHERKRPLEKIETLVQLGYELYSTPGLEQIIQSHCPKCDTITVDIDDCINHVLEDELTACLTEEFFYHRVASKPLDLIKEPLLQTALVTRCRDNWPLYDRMNEMYMRVFESGLPNFWAEQQTHKSLRERQEQDIERSSTEYRPIKLYKLLFAFQFLGIGLFLSTIVFIAELLVKKYGSST